MPRLYIDLDNNKLVTGPNSTQIAIVPTLYQGDSPNLEIELLQRKDGALSHYTSTASALNVRIGALGGSSIASALSLSAVTLSINATATAGILSAVTATGVIQMLGSTQATATASLNSPVTGSITASFSKVQLPTISPILKQNQLISLETSICGEYFTSVPCVFVSEPDIFDRKYINLYTSSQGSTSEAIYTQEDGENWPGLLGGQLYFFSEPNSGITGTGAIISKYGSVTSLAVGSATNISGVFAGTITAAITNFSGYSQISGFVTLRKPTLKAQLSASLDNGKISLSIENAGNNYSDSPDIFVVPSPEDYTLGSSKTISAAQISGRTSVITSTAHGLTAGDLVYVEALDYYDSGSGFKSFGVKGIWPIISVTSNSLTFRIDRFACLPSSVLTLSTTGAKIYPVILTKRLSSCTVSCAGSGFYPNTSIPFEIASDSCGGKSASGVIGVTNAGQLASITVSCVGSGFTTSATVVSFAPYKTLGSVSVTCAGAGYWVTPPSVSVDNYGFVATAPGATQAVISSTLNNDGTIILTIQDKGYGYISTPNITIEPPNLGNGIKSVSLATRGVGYSDGTYSCTVSAPPAGGAQAIVNFTQNGALQQFEVVNSGRGYVTTPGIVVNSPDLGGQLLSITVTCKGAGYDSFSVPSVSITGGGGSGSTAEAVVLNGEIVQISVACAGYGYSSAPSVTIESPQNYVYYTKQINLSSQSVTSFLSGQTSSSAYMQVDEKSGSLTNVLAQIPINIQARID